MSPRACPPRTHGTLSTQQSFGQILVSMSRDPKLAPRIVTTSPDVSTSTNLSGWIAKQGVFSFTEGEILRARGKSRTELALWPRRSAHRAGDLGDESLYDARHARPSPAELTGQQLIPHRHRLRPVRPARARLLHLRPLPANATLLHRRRHAFRGQPRARRRRAPVDRYAVPLRRAAQSEQLRTLLRPRAGLDHA